MLHVDPQAVRRQVVLLRRQQRSHIRDARLRSRRIPWPTCRHRICDPRACVLRPNAERHSGRPARANGCRFSGDDHRRSHRRSSDSTVWIARTPERSPGVSGFSPWAGVTRRSSGALSRTPLAVAPYGGKSYSSSPVFTEGSSLDSVDWTALGGRETALCQPQSELLLAQR